jgi:hypothetical protein
MAQAGPPAAKPVQRTGGDADRLKAALEAKRKMMIVAALDKGTISIEGDQICVSYAREDAKCKTEIEARPGRIAIEDACEAAFGRRLTLRVTIAEESEAKSVRSEKQQQSAGDNPKLKALVDKFHGEIIEVITPES